MSTDGAHLQPTDVSAEESDAQTEFVDDSPAVPAPVGPDEGASDATDPEPNADEKVTDPQPDVWADADAKE